MYNKNLFISSIITLTDRARVTGTSLNEITLLCQSWELLTLDRAF